MAVKKFILPQSNFRWVNPDGTPSLVFLLYMQALDQLVNALAGNSVGAPVQLTQAANDGAAAAAGVAVGGLYRNGSAVLVRVT
jgi:hypothetical protein